MCFTKSSPVAAQEQDSVVQHEADASLTKNSKNASSIGAFQQNVKTTPIGLEDNANTKKKTLLGE